MKIIEAQDLEKQIHYLIFIIHHYLSHQPDIDMLKSLYAKDPFDAKYQLLINKRESKALKDLNGSIAFIRYSNGMDDIYKKIEEYYSNKKRKILIVFNNMFADILSNKKSNPTVSELLIGR